MFYYCSIVITKSNFERGSSWLPLPYGLMDGLMFPLMLTCFFLLVHRTRAHLSKLPQEENEQCVTAWGTIPTRKMVLPTNWAPKHHKFLPHSYDINETLCALYSREVLGKERWKYVEKENATLLDFKQPCNEVNLNDLFRNLKYQHWKCFIDGCICLLCNRKKLWLRRNSSLTSFTPQREVKKRRFSKSLFHEDSDFRWFNTPP